ncbi:MAG: carbohydrate kinase family protein [Candidatus Helarchaeota archaeon]
MTIFVIGHLAIDEVIIDGKERPYSLGGTAAFSSIVCSRLAAPENVSVISKIGPDFPETFLSILTKFNVDIQYIKRVKRHSTRYVLEYWNDERKLTLKSVCAPITIEDFPKGITNANLIYFGPIANEIPLETIINTKEISNSLLALDIQGLIRFRDSDGTLYFRSSEKIDEILSYIDIVKLDLAEAQIVTGASKLRDITTYLSQLGLKLFIITKSRGGSILYYDGKIVKIPAILLKQIYNTTGAGDCFFSSFLVEYLRTNDPFVAIQFATKAVSYLIGSPEGVESFLAKGNIYQIIDNFIEQNKLR